MQKKAAISFVLLLFFSICSDRMAVLLIKREAAQNDYWVVNQLKIFELSWDNGHFKSCTIRTDYKFYKSQTCFIRYTPSSSSISYIYTPPVPILFRRDGTLGLPTFGIERDDNIRFVTPFQHYVSFSILKDGEIQKITINNNVPDGEPATFERINFGKILPGGEIKIYGK